MPKMLNKPIVLAATLVLGVLASAPLYADAVMMHFALASSTPEAKATIEEFHAIQLTFTQVPKEGGQAHPFGRSPGGTGRARCSPHGR